MMRKNKKKEAKIIAHMVPCDPLNVIWNFNELHTFIMHLFVFLLDVVILFEGMTQSKGSK